jgi:hypothetical protein
MFTMTGVITIAVSALALAGFVFVVSDVRAYKRRREEIRHSTRRRVREAETA